MGISKQAISQLVETLVTMGYVARHAAADDRRRTLLHLTARGPRRGTRSSMRPLPTWRRPWRDTIGRERLHELHGALVALDEASEETLADRTAPPLNRSRSAHLHLSPYPRFSDDADRGRGHGDGHQSHRADEPHVPR